ncbi:MAG: hypothetical protein HFE86_08810 [Clostridiales bacterium]|nr:hypothetical protein [Clostridiales bacterium]
MPEEAGAIPDEVQDDSACTGKGEEEEAPLLVSDEEPPAPVGKKSRFRARLIGVCALAALALTAGGLALAGVFQRPAADPAAGTVSGPGSGRTTLAGNDSSGTALPAVTRADRIIGAWVAPGRDFFTEGQDGAQAAAALDAAIEAAGAYACNTILLPVNDKALSAAPEGGSFLDRAVTKAHEKGMALYAVQNLTAGSDGGQADLSRPEAAEKAAKDAATLAARKGLDGLLLEGVAYGPEGGSYASYAAEGGGMGYEAYRRDRLTAAVRQVTSAVRAQNGNLYLGLLADPVWATGAEKEEGIGLEGELPQSYAAGADTLSWLRAGYFDWVMVRATSTADGLTPFGTVAAWWGEKAAGSFGLCFLHPADAARSAAVGYESADQMLRQVIALRDIPAAGSAFYTMADLTGDTTGGAAVLQKYLTGQLPEGYEPADLRISSPAKQNLTTHESSIGFVGASDPQFPITLNGQAVERTEAGYFSLQLDLQLGANTFTFQHKGQTLTYTVTYKQILLKEVAPAGNLTLDAGSVIMVKAVARRGSTVTARLGDASITLEPQGGDNQEDAASASADFITYLGSFSMPADLTKDTRIGTVSFQASYNGQSESMSGGRITVRAGITDDPGLPPFSANGDGSENYINVGTGLIAEVSSYQIETFDGNIIDDRSRPTNNYLPAGTVDYCSRSTVMDAGSGYTYRVLRYGKRVYTKSKEKGDNVKVYEGSLPETNNVTAAGVSQDSRFLTMAFDVDWKAPFRFKLAPQGYKEPYPARGAPNYSISSPTFDHVDITFCYAGTAQGKVDLPDGNPVFSGAEWIKNEADYTLRLYLKKAGAFYGWNAEYNGQGQLVFSFLKPVQLGAADNAYGVSLNGVKIVLDPGHGGSDPGAVGSDPRYTEAALNSILTYKVRDRLTALGAQVTLTKNDSDRVGLDPRVRTVKSVKPDLFVSFHRNSSTSTRTQGYESYYFNAFSEPLSRAVYNRNAGLYLDQRGNKWGNFYVMRVSDCPAILTENGFVSNADEYSLLVADAFNDRAADATVQGIVDYLKSIQY